MITLQEIKLWIQSYLDNVYVSIGEVTEGSDRQAAIRTVKGAIAPASIGKSSSYCNLSIAVQYAQTGEDDAENVAWQIYDLLNQASSIGAHAINHIQMAYEYPLWIRKTSEGATVFEAAALINYQNEEGE
ncbi:hypothetical protein GSF08_09665 [Clostridiaceae bacterium DONG20-135]|uniref:Uncharacterized protein n=1 Tax=Copranaerobaculum intestinale TaxID=2692629 RepID=A0A6N8U8F0_9FIRM|nr:minor capsid protein [Copranaerobaculum intestinale]MXQ74202.1 hypothetical protein [Copranaerobaculum intestinale]